ncbi:GpE family phage tail protein [Celerinatantimonas sp. MCCC 1A17872]
MADLALVFHWGPSELNALALCDLMSWREQARARWEQNDGQ